MTKHDLILGRPFVILGCPYDCTFDAKEDTLRINCQPCPRRIAVEEIDDIYFVLSDELFNVPPGMPIYYKYCELK